MCKTIVLRPNERARPALRHPVLRGVLARRAVPRRVDDAAPGQAPELHTALAVGPPARLHARPGVPAPHHGARVHHVQRPRGRARLPEPLSQHHHRLQLLLLHLPRAHPVHWLVSAAHLSDCSGCTFVYKV